MTYTVQKLATLAGVTTRTLHHYDEIGLLKPARKSQNGYREYGETELLRLQQIMFFRELEFPLKDIKNILSDPMFDMAASLRDHRTLIQIKRRRMDDLLKTIDKTLNKIKRNKTMEDTELYDGFSKEEAAAYAKEAKERWGNTEAYKQSTERVAKMSKDDMQRVKEAGDLLLKEVVHNIDKSPNSPEVQELIGKHYDGLRAFYEPSISLYRGLGTMYVEDERFAGFFKKYHEDLPTFMRDAMHAYCDAHA